LVESVAGTATLKAAVGELVPLTDSLCTDQVPTTVAEEVGLELYGTTFFLAQARTICDSARQRLQALARTLSNEQTIKACSEWVDLGEHVAMFLSDEEQSLENSGDEIEPEDWTGFDYVHFSYLADQTFVRPNDSQRNVDRCCKAVHKPEEKLRPPLDERSVDQQEIIDLEIIPTSFAGWFQVEAGLWPLLYGKRNERQCAERDALFVRWKQEERAKQPNIYVMRRWNGLPEAERQRIAPDCWHDVSRNNVKEVLEIAELREKADELDRLKRIF
jgi:hypothetical protein